MDAVGKNRRKKQIAMIVIIVLLLGGLAIAIVKAFYPDLSSISSCERGDSKICVKLAMKNFNYKTDTPENPERFRYYTRKACEQNYGKGCYLLGLFWKKGLAGTIDKKKARKYLKKACDLGPILDGACYLYAGMLTNGVGGVTDLKKAHAMWWRLCSKDVSGEDCFGAGANFLPICKQIKGEKEEKECLVKTLKYFKKGCAKNHTSSCWMSTLLTKRIGDKEDFIRYFEKSLNLPLKKKYFYNVSACYAVLRNKASALEFLKKAIAYKSKYRERAKKDEDFKEFWNDEEFKKIVADGDKQ